MQRSYELGNGRSKPKKNQFDYTKSLIPEISTVAYGPCSLKDLVPILIDKLVGKHTRPALCSLVEAKELVKSAISDFPKRPEMTVASTIPRACSYALGATVQLMKSNGLPRSEIMELLRIFKEAKNDSSWEAQRQIEKLISNNTSSINPGHAQLRDVANCASELLVLGHKDNGLSYKLVGVEIKSILESLDRVISNYQI